MLDASPRAAAPPPPPFAALKAYLNSPLAKTFIDLRTPGASGRGQRQRFTVKRDIPGLGRVRVIALRAR